jgi:hypothetical protein
MRHFQTSRRGALCVVMLGLLGCSEAKIYHLDKDLARSSLEEAMQAWIDGQTPEDLQPGMYVRDPDWEAGKKLVSFEILKDEDGDPSNLHLRVKRKFNPEDRAIDPTVKYIISTSPGISIAPQL